MNAYELIIGRGEPGNQSYVIKDAVEGNEVAKHKQPNTLTLTIGEQEYSNLQMWFSELLKSMRQKLMKW